MGRKPGELDIMVLNTQLIAAQHATGCTIQRYKINNGGDVFQIKKEQINELA